MDEPADNVINVFQNDASLETPEPATEAHVSVLAEAPEAPKNNFDEAADTFRDISRQLFGAFLTIEAALKEAAQLSTNLAAAFELMNQQETNNEGDVKNV